MLGHRTESHGVGRHGLSQSMGDRSEAAHQSPGVLGELPLQQRAGEHVQHMGIDHRPDALHEVTGQGPSDDISVGDPNARSRPMRRTASQASISDNL
jgi:hypothetical protein